MTAPRRRNNKGFVLLTGIEDVDRKLRQYGPKVGNPSARTGLTKGTRLAVKLMKQQTGTKSVKRALGGNVKRRRSGSDKGRITAKAGAAVGKKQPRGASVTTNPSGGPGKGIAARNVHWYILGTQARFQATSGRATGSMPANDIVQRAMASGQSAVLKVIENETRTALAKNLKKHKGR